MFLKASMKDAYFRSAQLLFPEFLPDSKSKKLVYVKNFPANPVTMVICFSVLVNVYWSKTDRSVAADKAASLAQTEPVILL